MTIYIEDLNDDCLRSIINLLPFRDLILLSQVNRRFQYLIEEKWSFKNTCQRISLSQYFYKYSKFEAFFPKFIHTVSYMVEEIELNTYHLERWGPLLRKQNFPNIRSCTATISQDDQILFIVVCFPKIIKLTLRGQVTGKNICELWNLRELHFDVNDFKLKDAHLRQLYKKLPLEKLTLFSEDHRTSCGFSKAIDPLYLCNTLQELRVAGDIIHTTISKIKKVRNLRKITAGVLLSFRFIPYPLEDIGTHFGAEVETIIFNHVIRDRADHLKGLNNMTNLRKLILYDDSVTDEQLQLIGNLLRKTLEEFHYLRSGRSFEDAEKFIVLIAHCTRLKILDVSGTSVDLKFVQSILAFLIKQRRSHPLLLRCGDTKVAPSDVQKLRLPDNFKISFDKEEIELPEEYFFQVILNKGAF